MKKREVLENLKINLEKYFADGFLFHRRFIEEVKELLFNASGQEKEIFALIIKQFSFIKSMGTDVYKADSNEIIKYQTRDYYSLHLSGKAFNLRFLMTFDSSGNPIFLTAFYERSGKRVTDYTQRKEVLEQRLSEVESEE